MPLFLLIKIWIAYLILRLQAAWDSLFAVPDSYGDSTYIRAYYPLLRKDIEKFNQPGLKAIEFGGSNEIVKKFLPKVDYETAPNYPEVDIQNLKGFPDNKYDIVVLDQILEHVEEPFQAMSEIHRILKPGGTLIAAVPFLVYVHPTPDDFWRFTESGIRKLCKNFSRVDVSWWGNRVAMHLINKYGFPLKVWQARMLLGFTLRNEKNFPVIYWFLAQK